MKTKKLMIMLFSCMLMLLTSVAYAQNNNTDWQATTITVEGVGVAPTNATSEAQAKALARRAAVVDAYRNLAEEVQGVNVDATTTVKDAMVASDIINTNVRALIKGARVIAEEEQADGSYKVTMQLPIYGSSNSIAAAVLPANNDVAPINPPSAGYEPPYINEKHDPDDPHYVKAYTGLIVDCRTLTNKILQPMMSPVIKRQNGEPIYGYKNLDYKFVIAHGMASYVSEDTIGMETRAGRYPLCVNAIDLQNHNGYPVISDKDADMILYENQKSHFLEKCAVVFIR